MGATQGFSKSFYFLALSADLMRKYLCTKRIDKGRMNAIVTGCSEPVIQKPYKRGNLHNEKQPSQKEGCGITLS